MDNEVQVQFGADYSELQSGSEAAARVVNDTAASISDAFRGANDSLDALIGHVPELGTEIDSAASSVKGSIGDLDQGFNDVDSSIQNLGGGASAIFEGMKGGIGGIIDEIKGLAAALAGVFGIKELYDFEKSEAELGEHTRNLAAEVGTSVEKLTAFTYAAGEAGVGADRAAFLLEHLERQMIQAEGGSKIAQRAFAAIGITADDLKTKFKSVDDILPVLADAFSASADGPAKTAISLALMTRGGTDMIPILDKGRAGLEELERQGVSTGATLTTQTATAMADTHAELYKLAGLMSGAATSAFLALKPLIDDLATGFEHLATEELDASNQGQNASPIFTAVKWSIYGLSIALGDAYGYLQLLGTGLASFGVSVYNFVAFMASATKDLSTLNIDDLKEKFKEWRAQVGGVRDQTKQDLDSILASMNDWAQRMTEDAEGITATHDRMKESFDALTNRANADLQANKGAVEQWAHGTPVQFGAVGTALKLSEKDFEKWVEAQKDSLTQAGKNADEHVREQLALTIIEHQSLVLSAENFKKWSDDLIRSIHNVHATWTDMVAAVVGAPLSPTATKPQLPGIAGEDKGDEANKAKQLADALAKMDLDLQLKKIEDAEHTSEMEVAIGGKTIEQLLALQQEYNDQRWGAEQAYLTKKIANDGKDKGEQAKDYEELVLLHQDYLNRKHELNNKYTVELSKQEMQDVQESAKYEKELLDQALKYYESLRKSGQISADQKYAFDDTAVSHYKESIDQLIQAAQYGLPKEGQVWKDLQKIRDAADDEATNHALTNLDKLQEETKAAYTKMFQPFQSFIDQMISGGQTWAQMFRSLLITLVQNFAHQVEEMAIAWLAKEHTQTAATEAGETARAGISTAGAAEAGAAQTALAQKSIITNAWDSASSAFNWVMKEVPWPFNLPLAVASGAAAAALVLAFGGNLPSFEVGAWEIPGNTLAMVHKGEMIVPAGPAGEIRSGNIYGSSSSASFNLHYGPHINMREPKSLIGQLRAESIEAMDWMRRSINVGAGLPTRPSGRLSR